MRKYAHKIITFATAVIIIATIIASCGMLTGCNTQAAQVSYNISQQADLFNVTRKLTVINARTDTVLLELTGTFSLDNNMSTNELEIICQVGENTFEKHFVYLNEYTLYVVEDISGSTVDKYHYEINFLPEWGYRATFND